MSLLASPSTIKKINGKKRSKKISCPGYITSDLDAFDNKVAKLYGVQPIPDNFLIDPQGKIIARQLGGKAVEEKLDALIKTDGTN
ncbi:MAG: hypothetical protein WDO16_24830 [Bacteroidota bacterium]